MTDTDPVFFYIYSPLNIWIILFVLEHKKGFFLHLNQVLFVPVGCGLLDESDRSLSCLVPSSSSLKFVLSLREDSGGGNTNRAIPPPLRFLFFRFCSFYRAFVPILRGFVPDLRGLYLCA